MIYDLYFESDKAQELPNSKFANLPESHPITHNYTPSLRQFIAKNTPKLNVLLGHKLVDLKQCPIEWQITAECDVLHFLLFSYFLFSQQWI